MKIIIVEGKAWEQFRSSFADFIHRTEQLIGNPPETEAWLDNEAVKTLNSYHTVATAQRMIHQLERYSAAIINLQVQAIQLTMAFEDRTKK